jgi:magnesium-transporting ATPase (P-type)
VKGVDNDPAVIPFSSDIKFNLIIRDMKKENLNPISAEENMFVFLKGAPERVLERCSSILMNGEDRPLDSNFKFLIDAANARFGSMGERVLAFARTKLDPLDFKKSGYPFDVKKWKSWKDVKEHDHSISGWFPMHNLQLIGLVSLNDPPRPGVDLSVLKCRTAGIKVIMVTGDQPFTAAAIAHKVNIISD